MSDNRNIDNNTDDTFNNDHYREGDDFDFTANIGNDSTGTSRDDDVLGFNDDAWDEYADDAEPDPDNAEPDFDGDAVAAGNGQDTGGIADMPDPARLEAKKKAEKRRFALVMVAMSLMLLFGIGLIIYPTAADAWNRHVSSRAIAGYAQKVEDTSKEEREAQIAKARAYNETLVGQGNSRFLPTEEEKKEYNSILDITGTGIMGYVTIPKIKTRLPIYHGTDEAVLQIASGHLEGSSLPVGGESTHTVLTGHTGLPSAMLFTGIDTLEKGDKFTITIYDEILTYEVDGSETVLPTNVKPLAIEEGKDLASLLTCTPYGVNSHRLIVTGHRIPTPTAEKTAEFKDEALTQDILITAVIIIMTIGVAGAVFIVQYNRRKKPTHHAKARK